MVKEFVLTLKFLKQELLLRNILNPSLYSYILDNTIFLHHHAVKELNCCLTALRKNINVHCVGKVD
jgi:hypothetical protein